MQDAARWYVLRTFKYELQARRDFEWEAQQASASTSDVVASEGGPLGFSFEWFVPVHWQLERHNVDQPRPQMRPLVASYVFVRTDLERLRRIVAKYDYLYPYRPAGRDAVHEYCVWVGDAEMRSFMIVARAYEANRRFYDVRTTDVVQGDRVRVVGGVFDGVEGILQKVSRGSNDGEVLVELPGLTRLRTWRIEARYIEILEFAPGSSGLYDNLEFFMTTAVRALKASHTPEGISTTDVENLRLYVRRFGNLRTGSELTESTLRLLLFLSHHLLGDAADVMRLELARCLELLGRVKSESQRAFLLIHLYGALGDERYRTEARALIARWLPEGDDSASSLAGAGEELGRRTGTGEGLASLSPKKRRLIETLEEFESIRSSQK